MVKTNAAERMRKSRARQTEAMKLNEKMKSRNRMRVFRLKIKGDLKLKKKEGNASMLRMRERKKSMSMLDNSTNPYSSLRAFRKAVQKLKRSLPSSPRRKTAVVKKIASDMGIITLPTKSRNSNGLSNSTIECVKYFCSRDDISRQLPGRKNFKSVRISETKKRVLLQKRLLIYNLKDAFHLFKLEYPNVEIGLSKFCELRPVEVETVASKDHQVCCCIYCQNFAFLLQKCKWKNSNIKNINDIINIIVCDRNNSNCMRQNCKNCQGQIIKFMEKELDVDKEIKVHQWKKGILEDVTFDAKHFMGEIICQSISIFKHLYNVSRQTKELRRQKDGLEPNQLLIQIDFSQDFNIKHQNEVMAAHWRTDSSLSVTIYTAVAYFRRAADEDLDTKSYAIISDCNRHTSSIVKIFNQNIIDEVEEDLQIKAQKIFIWSDGAAAHFKNRYSMALMLSNPAVLEWNFTASYHGKGPHDGIGAVLKRHVWKKILQGQKIIKNSQDFFNEVSTSDIKIKCMFVEEKRIREELKEIESSYHTINELKGIQSCHSIKKSDLTSVNMYTNTGDRIPFQESINLIKTYTTNVLCKEPNQLFFESFGFMWVNP